MSANVSEKIQIKSAEQRMIEAATAEYASKLKSVLGQKASAVIQIEGVPISKIATIADFLRDEEGEAVKIKSFKSFSGTKNYINQSLKGEGYTIEQISE